MNYEKEYEDAVKRAKAMIKVAEKEDEVYKIAITIFPELAESENEGIRKELITHCKNIRCVTEEFAERKAKWIAWLEKQGEQKLQGKTAIEAINEENVDNRTCVESIDNIEPKFKIGDWVIYNNEICQIVKREEGCNKLVTVFGIEKELVNERNLSTARLWTILDAKEGDVLVTKYNQPFIYNGNYDLFNVGAYCGMDCLGEIFIESSTYCQWSSTKVKPATKEQRDLLFQKMKEAGYEWDVDKKELKKIEQKPIDKIEPIFEVGDTMRTLQESSNGITSGLPVVVSIDNEYYRCNNETIAIKDQNNYEYPPINKKHVAWSKEDEAIFDKVIARLHKYTPGDEEYADIYYWLKALKDRILPQPRQEWSEEDEKMLNNMDITLFEETSIPNVKYWKFMDWLKSLKQRMNND